MVVRDPNFWRRFSIAVHQDDAVKEEMTKRPDLKHSYVPSISSVSRVSPPLASPTSQSHLSPAFPPTAVLPSASASSPTTPTTTSKTTKISQQHQQQQEQPRPRPPKRHRSKLQKTPSTRPLLRPAISQQQQQQDRIQHPEPTTTIEPPSSSLPSPRPSRSRPTSRRPSIPRLTFHPLRLTTTAHNSSTLSLSGRPHSSFKFWTTITANPAHRDSWLESQTKKRRQRTWICWCFWLCLCVLIAGIVVTLLILKGRGII